VPLPEEGGYYRETYRASLEIEADGLPSYYAGPRCASTAIYYLLTPEEFSGMHRVRSDEVFHFYLGDPVEMLQLAPDGSSRVVVLGTELHQGMELQVVVPAGVWQGARLRAGGQYALLGATVAPGFEFADFETGSFDTLVAQYPSQRTLLAALTR
jgi:predicted cupin superfamily sugar epimerase